MRSCRDVIEGPKQQSDKRAEHGAACGREPPMEKLRVDSTAWNLYPVAIDIFLLSFGYCAIGTAPSTNPPFKTIAIIRNAFAWRSSLLL